METKFKLLEGRTLQNIDNSIGHTIELNTHSETFDLDLVLFFSSGVTLSIYNKHEFIGVSEPVDLIGNKVLSVEYDDAEFKVNFKNGSINVDVSDDGYVGPEAMSLHIGRDEIIIWD